MTSGCKDSLKKPSHDSTLATWGGKVHAFADLPGYFTEFFIDDGPNNQTLPFCSGTHIGNGYILTAAHCLDSYLSCEIDPKDIFINVIASSGRHEQKLALADVRGIAVHAGWPTSVSSQSSIDDIALIKTDLTIANQAYLPEDPPTTLQPRLSSGEWWIYGVGGSLKHQSHHKQPRIRPSYFGGVVAADSPPHAQPSSDELAQWKQQAGTHPLLTEKGQAYLTRINTRQSGDAETPSRPTSSSSMPQTSPPDHSALKTSSVAMEALPSHYLFDDTLTTGAPEHKPVIYIYPGHSDHPYAIDLTCSGDSGGPLVFRRLGADITSRDILLGIFSSTTKHLNIRSVTDLVMHYNLAGQMFLPESSGPTFTPECADFNTLQQRLYRELSFLQQGTAVSVWYYRSWIEAAKQSLASGHHQPLSCAQQDTKQEL